MIASLLDKRKSELVIISSNSLLEKKISVVDTTSSISLLEIKNSELETISLLEMKNSGNSLLDKEMNVLEIRSSKSLLIMIMSLLIMKTSLLEIISLSKISLLEANWSTISVDEGTMDWNSNEDETSPIMTVVVSISSSKSTEELNTSDNDGVGNTLEAKKLVLSNIASTDEGVGVGVNWKEGLSVNMETVSKSIDTDDSRPIVDSISSLTNDDGRSIKLSSNISEENESLIDLAIDDEPIVNVSSITKEDSGSNKSVELGCGLRSRVGLETTPTADEVIIPCDTHLSSVFKFKLKRLHTSISSMRIVSLEGFIINCI